MPESPLFARAFDLALQTMLTVERFPRHGRAVLGRTLETSVLDFHRQLVRATRRDRHHRPDFVAAIDAADEALLQHGFALRLAVERKLLTPGRFGELSRLSMECGRLLGGLVKASQRRAGAAHPGPTRGLVEQHSEQPARLEPEQESTDEQE